VALGRAKNSGSPSEGGGVRRFSLEDPLGGHYSDRLDGPGDSDESADMMSPWDIVAELVRVGFSQPFETSSSSSSSFPLFKRSS
jgi:hypothetical protein